MIEKCTSTVQSVVNTNILISFVKNQNLDGSRLIRISLLMILPTLQEMSYLSSWWGYLYFDIDQCKVLSELKEFISFPELSCIIYVKPAFSNAEVRLMLHVNFSSFILFYLRTIIKTHISFLSIMVRIFLKIVRLWICCFTVISIDHI